MKKSKLSTKKKYQLYEAAVQDPTQQISLFEQVYQERFGESPDRLREDFCGTHWISSEWVKSRNSRSALGIDIDAEPLKAGRELRGRSLSTKEKRRLKLLQQDVREPTAERFDVIAACNFSFFIFLERETLVEYFRSAYASLESKGAVILELCGGPGFIDTPSKEQRSVKYQKGKKKGKRWFTYIWRQKQYDPITARGTYSINFRFPDGKKYSDAFLYDWRVWTVQEVVDALRDAGFPETRVYWELDEDESDSEESEYEYRTEADNDYQTYICYVAGLRVDEEA